MIAALIVTGLGLIVALWAACDTHRYARQAQAAAQRAETAARRAAALARAAREEH